MNAASTQPTDPPQGPPRDYGRHFVTNVTFGVLSTTVRFGTNVFLIAYLVRRLGPERWGLVILAISVVAFLSLVQLGASAGIGKKLNTFMTRGETDAFQKYFTAGVVLCGLLAGVMLAGIALLLTVFWSRLNVSTELSTEGKLVLAAIGLSAVSTLLSLPYFACCQAVHRIDIHSKLEMVALLLRAGGAVLLFELTTPMASTYALLMFLANLLILAGGWLWVRRQVPAAKLRFRDIGWRVLWDVIAFNMLVMFNTINRVLFVQSPTIVLQTSAGLATAGLYGIGLQLDSVVRGFVWTGINAIRPVAVSFESAGQSEQFKALFRISSRIYAAAALIMWVGIVCLRKPFLHAWLARDMDELAAALPALIGATAIGVAAMPSGVFLLASERLRLPAIGGVVLGAAMITTMVYVTRMSQGDLLFQIAVILILFFGPYQLLRIWWAARMIPVRTRELLIDMALRPAIPAGAGALVLLAADRLGGATTVPQLALATASTLLVFGVVAYAALFSREERLLAARLVGKFRAR